ncbi:class I SAM-dependent methyltransferase [Nocardioides sp. zg-1228]|uniref:class I SAM-dependent methyltransferase n=1 Tax=Nocardioides sp. zg-1228 TaxID=2763008 RepID=UPI001642F672|nr:class I SAM-dependent methyltransferase [Nocardioides sp. zg-1228]MBC2934589.1 class I SAM-dependent methyltransferase [Nocardioides sp. zg-1228]QSF59340.1 class I SAM-dependent methyltransferase [Nocardioides sp. zg-1228]
MSLRVWDERVVPRLTDLSLRGHEVGELRTLACAGLTGRVLEVGFGSGLNVRWYPPAVTSVTAIEPSDLGWELSEPRRARGDVPIERAGLDGQRLDLPDGSHDSALVTFSLCTIPDPVAALREARRVVGPGGRLHALEHGAAPEESVRRWQRRLEPVQRAVAGGCHLTRDVVALAADAGWRVDQVEQSYLPGPGLSRPWTYVYRLGAG